MSNSVRPHRQQPTRLPIPGILQARTLSVPFHQQIPHGLSEWCVPWKSNLLVVLLTLHNTFFLAHFLLSASLFSFSSIFSGNSGISISLCIGHCFIQTTKSHFFFSFAPSPGVFHGVLRFLVLRLCTKIHEFLLIPSPRIRYHWFLIPVILPWLLPLPASQFLQLFQVYNLLPFLSAQDALCCH